MKTQARKNWVLPGVWWRIFLVVLTFAVSPVAQAQSYSIVPSVIAGGGGTSTGAVFSVSGTIGQADAGTSTSGTTYAVHGGYWGAIAAIQTPGAPLLSIRFTPTNTVVVSWPSPSTDFVLQQNPNIGTTNWTDVGMAPADDGTTKSVLVTMPAGNRFYRLRKP